MKTKLKKNKTYKEKNTRDLTINNSQLMLLCLIPMAVLFIFNYLPLGGILIAFKDYRFDKGILGSDWVGLENFKFFVMSNDFVRVTWNTIYMNFLMIVFGMITALAVAVVLYQLKSRRATKLYQSMMVTPNFVSWVIVGYIAYAFFNPSYGLLNSILEKIGMQRVDVYSEPGVWPALLVTFSVWKIFGMDSAIYYSALMGIDSEIIEAAQIDGANRWHIVRYIMIPSVTSVMSILFIMKMGGIFRADFGLFYQLTRDIGALQSTTDVIDTYLFRTMRVIGDMGVSSAIGLMQSIVGVVMLLITNAIVKKADPDRGLF